MWRWIPASTQNPTLPTPGTPLLTCAARSDPADLSYAPDLLEQAGPLLARIDSASLDRISRRARCATPRRQVPTWLRSGDHARISVHDEPRRRSGRSRSDRDQRAGEPHRKASPCWSQARRRRRRTRFDWCHVSKSSTIARTTLPCSRRRTRDSPREMSCSGAAAKWCASHQLATKSSGQCGTQMPSAHPRASRRR